MFGSLIFFLLLLFISAPFLYRRTNDYLKLPQRNLGDVQRAALDKIEQRKAILLGELKDFLMNNDEKLLTIVESYLISFSHFCTPCMKSQPQPLYCHSIQDITNVDECPHLCSSVVVGRIGGMFDRPPQRWYDFLTSQHGTLPGFNFTFEEVHLWRRNKVPILLCVTLSRVHLLELPTARILATITLRSDVSEEYERDYPFQGYSTQLCGNILWFLVNDSIRLPKLPKLFSLRIHLSSFPQEKDVKAWSHPFRNDPLLSCRSFCGLRGRFLCQISLIASSPPSIQGQTRRIAIDFWELPFVMNEKQEQRGKPRSIMDEHRATASQRLEFESVPTHRIDGNYFYCWKDDDDDCSAYYIPSGELIRTYSGFKVPDFIENGCAYYLNGGGILFRKERITLTVIG